MFRFLEASVSVWSPSTFLQASKPTVKLHFVCNTINHFESFDDDETQNIIVFRDPDRFNSIIKLDRSTLLSDDYTATFHQIIQSKLLEYRRLLTLWGGLQLLVSHTIPSVRTLLGNTNSVRVHVDFHEYHVCDHGILFRNLAEENHGMKPACKSATIQMLKRVEEIHSDDDDETSCTVCLEDLGRDHVLCMPCSHSFHASCILKWLDTSHYCPICRFELPTQQ